jgi:hypothetical protein
MLSDFWKAYFICSLNYIVRDWRGYYHMYDIWTNEMKWNEMKWNEMKWNEMKNEMKWNEMKWNEMKWNEMKWNEMKISLTVKENNILLKVDLICIAWFWTWCWWDI